MVPGGRPIIAIGYKYNARKVLYFIVTYNTGITQADITHLSKYPDQFSNFSISPVVCTLVVYKLFGSITEVESHNKSRQSDLVLEKFWVTQYGWLRFCTIVSMVIYINNFWVLFCYGVKRDHYETFVGIR